jgi:hypothetical protein
MSGIYILQTKDGYRVNYSNDYDCLFTSFNTDNMIYNIDVYYLRLIFGNCTVYHNEKLALESAKGISRVQQDTEDGIMLIGWYRDYTFEELVNGKANKTE